MTDTVLKPMILWAQRPESIFITINQSNMDKDRELKVEKDKIVFKGKSGGQEYAFELEFYAEVNADEVQIRENRVIEMVLPKLAGASWSQLYKGPKQKWVQVDWHKWVDSDEDEPGEGFDMQGMGGMPPGGLPGMMGPGGMNMPPGMQMPPGMGGMPDMEGMDFSKMMEQMGGMGGMGGPDEDDSDDDDLPDLDGAPEAVESEKAAAEKEGSAKLVEEVETKAEEAKVGA